MMVGTRACQPRNASTPNKPACRRQSQRRDDDANAAQVLEAHQRVERLSRSTGWQLLFSFCHRQMAEYG